MMTSEDQSQLDPIAFHEQAIAQMKGTREGSPEPISEENWWPVTTLHRLGYLMQALADNLDICQTCLHEILEKSMQSRQGLLEKGTISQLPFAEYLENLAQEIASGRSAASDSRA